MGLVVCCNCKGLLDKNEDIEGISHGLCLPCKAELYPDYLRKGEKMMLEALALCGGDKIKVAINCKEGGDKWRTRSKLN